MVKVLYYNYKVKQIYRLSTPCCKDEISIYIDPIQILITVFISSNGQ